MKINFESVSKQLENEFITPSWIAESGVSREKIAELITGIEGSYQSKAIIKAKTFEMIAERAQIGVDRDDIFQDKLNAYKFMAWQRGRWEKAVKEKYLPKETEVLRSAHQDFGAFSSGGDYGHTSPNTRLLLEVGFVGLIERVEKASKKGNLTEHQKEFYECCKIVCRAMITVANRLADAVEETNPDNAKALRSIANGAPNNIYEAMQIIVLYFFMHEYIAGTRVRTLGRLDVLLYPFYKNDIKNGTYTKDEIKEMIKFFLHKFWVAKVPFDLPFCLAGIDYDENEVTNEISYMIVDAYDELNIYSPKIHVRVSDKTPKDFVKRVLDCIRRGNSSFVFVNDRIVMKSLINVGVSEYDARDYVPIGCYEPAVWGMEVGCTGNGSVNLAKAVELVFTNGKDLAGGKLIGLETGKIETYEDFISALKKQISYMTETALDYIVKIEGYYRDINPDAILSAQYDHSIELGKDVYEGGAKYNNSSLYFYYIASLVDSVCAVKKLVFDEKRFTFEELGEILANNWEGHEKDRAIALRLREKYGNNEPLANSVTAEFADFCADLVNGKPNGRGGVFKTAFFSIDNYVYHGKKTMATPDGRYTGDPLSKNLCATVGADRNGITALIESVTKMDHTKFPNGSVLDVMLHPSAVSGDDGLDAFYEVLMTFFGKGGLALHGNVFDASLLKAAQKDPEAYKNLQVRVCGWNAYFVNLSKTEQDCFIRQAELLS